jgi:hypothetical protein
MGVRMYRVEYGFMAGRVCALVHTSAALIHLHSASETEALAGVRQLVGDLPKSYGVDAQIVILKLEPMECR